MLLSILLMYDVYSYYIDADCDKLFFFIDGFQKEYMH